jgi:chromosome segregation ATPase
MAQEPFIGLREWLEQRFAQHNREHQMIQDAVAKAEQSVNVRLEGMNELRAQINSERGSYLSRAEYDAKHEALAHAVDALERSMIAKIDNAERTLASRIASLENAQANMAGRLWAVGVGLTIMVVVINVALKLAP